MQCATEDNYLIRCLSDSIKYFHKMLPDREQSFGGFKAFIKENDSTGITNSCPGCSLLQAVHTIAKITKVKDLTLIILISLQPIRLRLLSRYTLCKRLGPQLLLSHNCLMRSLSSTVNHVAVTTLNCCQQRIFNLNKLSSDLPLQHSLSYTVLNFCVNTLHTD